MSSFSCAGPLRTAKVGLRLGRDEKGRCVSLGSSETVFRLPWAHSPPSHARNLCSLGSRAAVLRTGQRGALTDSAGTRLRSEGDHFCQVEGREIPDKNNMTMNQRERQEPKSRPECREFTVMGKKMDEKK